MKLAVSLSAFQSVSFSAFAPHWWGEAPDEPQEVLTSKDTKHTNVSNRKEHKEHKAVLTTLMNAAANQKQTVESRKRP